MRVTTMIAVALLTSGWAPMSAGELATQTPAPAPAPAQAERPQPPPADERTPPPEPRRRPQPGPLYRMDLTISELDGKTKANARAYTLLGRVGGERAESSPSLRVGSRVPVAGKDGLTYMNVGVNIDISQLVDVDGALTGTVSVEVSSLAPPELSGQAAGALAPSLSPPPGPNPVMRTLQLRTPFSITPGKPSVIGVIDDVNSPKRFQVELTATRQ